MKTISRRNFLKGTATGLVAAGILGTQAYAEQADGNVKVNYEKSIPWHTQYDVVVLGYGGAGAVTAITAADEGAKVLIAEKAPFGEEGGNTKVSGQYIFCPWEYEAGVEYMKNLRGYFSNLTDEMCEFLVTEFMKMEDWLTQMGGTITHLPFCEYPEEISDPSKVGTLQVDGSNFTGTYWKLLKKNVEKRSENIEIWYNSPAVKLIQDPLSKVILGVQVEKNGEVMNVRAKNGVVLACGGFENNAEMCQSFLQRGYIYPLGTTYNTGDGIRMSMEVGADLWHMGTMSGPWITFKEPDQERAIFPNSGMPTMLTKGLSNINVGPDGTRFVAENIGLGHRHGHTNYSGMYASMLTPLPMHTIFDEKARVQGSYFTPFSADFSEEIEKGWVIKADTIEELAEKLGTPKLAEEVALYNQFCETGVDIKFGRPANMMEKIDTPPYYAFEIVPAMVNTQGGPKRNTNAEILAVDGTPIPHLYSAGEIGSFFTDIYNAGGNLGETIVFGRIAGKNAAAEKDTELTVVVEEAKQPEQYIPFSEPSIVDNAVELGENEYLGEGQGLNGPIKVKVKMDGDKIAAIEVLEHTETPNIGDKAINAIPARIIEAQSVEVDMVTGATNTSRGLLEAVADALSKVGK